MVKFKNFVVSLGKTDIGSVHPLAYKFEGDHTMIEHVQPDCGCTAKPEVTEDSINLEFTDSVSDKVREDLKKKYGDLPQSYNKGITVYMNDGEPLKVKNTKGLDIYNPNKQSVRLYINGKHVY